MSILSRKYKEETDYVHYINWNGANSDIDPVFIYRLAAWARDNKTKIEITSPIGAMRSYRQQILAKHNQLYHGGNIAATPGTSWHGFGEAVDVSNLLMKNNYNSPIMLQFGLKKYGLCKPLAKGCVPNAAVENWHVQPIETAAQPKTPEFQLSFYNGYQDNPYFDKYVPVKCPKCVKFINKLGQPITKLK